jgi:putative nucleotidyltransferase with HDIG domain
MTLMLAVIASELLTMRLATALADILSERFPRFHDPSILYYGIPFAFGALLITLLVDVNLGILSSLTLAILAGVFYGDINLAAYLIIGSLAGIYSIRQYKDRAAILKAGLTIGIVNILCLASLDILRQIGLNLTDVLDQFVLALLSGMLAAALASMLLPALEALFKIVTDIRLLELSNLNAPILRRLSVEAPGTYHHSLMVATLAEVAAESVGANSLLARVAAYYHDLGKLLKPEYFVENQSYGSNKHEEIPPDMSSAILASHVKDGLQLAKESGLPQRITDMIPQHHGTRVMTYFYQKAKDAMIGKAGEIDEASFRYPGPKPQSKEAAIIMMADSVEAASRTLSEPAPALVQGMIDRLIDDIVRDDQCNECDITLRDVQLVKESFLKILTGIFHHRIDYPGYDFKATASDSR